MWTGLVGGGLLRDRCAVPVVLFLLSCGSVEVTLADAGDLPDAGVAIDAGEPKQAAALADEVAALASPWVEAGWIRGVSIGAHAPDGDVFRGLGRTARDGDVTDPDTLFEIGSITKTFTATLLAEAVRRGEATIDTTLAERHPDLDLPANGGASISLEHLAMHVSGLPRMPTNFAPADPSDPYVDYAESDLRAFLAGHRLVRAPGAGFEYSNVAVGLLGWSLARDATSFEGLLRDRVLDPIGLEDTRFELDRPREARLATGSDPEGDDVPPWNFDVLGPAGGLRSSARDVLSWAVAHLDPSVDGLGASLRITQQSRRDLGNGYAVGLGWFVVGGIVQHDGGVGGMQSFVAFRPDAGTAVSVLVNTSCGGCGPLWRALPRVLEDGRELPEGPEPDVELTAAQADRLTGDYRMPSGATLSVTRSGTSMWARLTGQSRLPIHPVAEDRALLRVVEAALVFAFDDDGPAATVALHQDGFVQTGDRIE